jgi:arsenate reductase
MHIVFYLPNCSTCTKVLKEVTPDTRFYLQNLKETPITAEQLDLLAKVVGSYNALFNKQSRKYREYGLGATDLSEQDCRSWILKEYTFLKRPIFLIGDRVFICRSNVVVDHLKSHLGK